jgi:hypothetical protein
MFKITERPIMISVYAHPILLLCNLIVHHGLALLILAFSTFPNSLELSELREFILLFSSGAICHGGL